MLVFGTYLDYKINSMDVDTNEFSRFIQTFDVLCFIETWAHKLKQFAINGYECYDVIRKNHSKAFRNSGGIAVLIKDKCYNLFDISNVRSESSNLIWIKFDIKPLSIILESGF